MNFDLSKIPLSKKDKLRGLCFPKKLTKDLAEDIGIMVGDGCIGKYTYNNQTNYTIRCDGSLRLDLPFFSKFVCPLKESLYGIKFKINFRFPNEIYLLVRSEGLFYFYTQILKMPFGKKDNIKIPQVVINSNKKIIFSFLRGLADTDFSLVFKKRHKNVYYYPTIKINTSSKELIEDLSYTLTKLKFKVTVSYEMKRFLKKTGSSFITNELDLNGVENLNRWIKLIGFSNPKNILKYKLWKKNGYCPSSQKIEDMLMGPRGFEFREPQMPEVLP